MFAWLVTIVLNESPMMVGVAQLALLFPATLLMLIGGSLADRLGGKKVAVVSQTLAIFPLGSLALVLLPRSTSALRRDDRICDCQSEVYRRSSRPLVTVY